jgi:hypothetical protein
MTTPTIQKNLDALLAARAEEHVTVNAQRKRISKRSYRRRALKWNEEQPVFWKMMRGKNWREPPAYLLRRDPFDEMARANLRAYMDDVRSFMRKGNAAPKPKS